MADENYMNGVNVYLQIIILFFIILCLLWFINPITGFLIISLNIGCAYRCTKWASKINKNKNLAFTIGFFFSLIGLLIYFILLNINKKKE